MITIPGEALPETKSLITTGRKHGGGIWAHAHAQHALGVAVELSNLGHGGVLPDRQLVLGEAVAGDDLLVLLVPQQRRDLRLGVNRVDAGTRDRVPEADVAISRATTSRKKVALPWAPRKSLDGCGVLGHRVNLVAIEAPDVHEVVVGTATSNQEEGKEKELTSRMGLAGCKCDPRV